MSLWEAFAREWLDTRAVIVFWAVCVAIGVVAGRLFAQ